MEAADFSIDQVRPAELPTPLRYVGSEPEHLVRYHDDEDYVLVSATSNRGSEPPSWGFQRAGPRERIAWDPALTTAGIITCGGLCPGLNDVIRALVMCLYHHYGVRRIRGIRYGYQGLAMGGPEPLELTPDRVRGINRDGGTILGSSRGGPTVAEQVDTIQRLGVNVLFVIGGDGTQRGSKEINAEAVERGYPLSVIGIPKTIDNDIAWVDQTFGFDTAVQVARGVIDGAHAEAVSARGGVGLVKLMGRDSGFITAHAALASMDANLVLVPEVPFELDGPRGLLEVLLERLTHRDHAVVVVAEGAGQDLFDTQEELFDASGNKLHKDIGLLLEDRIVAHARERGRAVTVKYFDPSYLVRSTPANAYDSTYCMRLAHNAVHAGMAGKTNMLVGKWYNKFTHVPLALATSHRKRLKPRGSLWRDVLEATGQPSLCNEKTMTYRSEKAPVEEKEAG